MGSFLLRCKLQTCIPLMRNTAGRFNDSNDATNKPNEVRMRANVNMLTYTHVVAWSSVEHIDLVEEIIV